MSLLLRFLEAKRIKLRVAMSMLVAGASACSLEMLLYSVLIWVA